MNKKLVLFMIFVVALSFILSYGFIKYKGNPDTNDKDIEQKEQGQGEQQKQEPKLPEIEVDPVKEQIKKMTLDEKIGQMVIAGIDGYEVDDNVMSMIQDYHVGGIILFSQNIKDSHQLLSLINSLKDANSKNKIPLFMSVDEEGGRISRMPEEFKNLPTNKTIGRVNNKEFSYKVGSVIAEEISSLGFNMDFAPVLDINSNPKNPVIGDRSFSGDPQVVSSLGIQTMKGLQQGGVIPVIKHFPGHGDTSVDSHVGLPLVDADLKRLNSFELVPFSDAVKSGADAVMIAHILLKKIDAQNPASMSKTVITDMLRKQLKFDGVVITDDMTMGAVTKNYKIEDAAVKTVNAGADIVLVCHGYENEKAVIKALKSGVESGNIKEEKIDESVYRILKLKQKYGLVDSMAGPVDVSKINSKINAILNTYIK